MTNLFSATNFELSGVSNSGQLQKTAELTSVSSMIAKSIFASIEASNEDLKPLVVESQKNNDAMDKLITTLYDLTTIDVEFLKVESSDTIEKMLKSQQSKRSRSKSKVMTVENFMAMLTGAIAENLLRIASGKTKSTSTGARSIEIVYDDESLNALRNDQEKLKKEIRNVQSKKSIMKSKANFSESDTRWLQLLDAEVVLKNMREAPQADERITKISDLMIGIDNVDNLKSAEAKELLKQILSNL